MSRMKRNFTLLGRREGFSLTEYLILTRISHFNWFSPHDVKQDGFLDKCQGNKSGYKKQKFLYSANFCVAGFYWL